MGQAVSKVKKGSQSTLSQNKAHTGYNGSHGNFVGDANLTSIAGSVNSEGISDPGDFEWMNTLSDEQSSYFFPTNDSETDRVHKQHLMLKTVFDGNLSPVVRDTIQDGAKILDVGCGPGSWIMEIANDFPTSECYAIDIVTTFPYSSSPDNLKFQTVDVLRGLPFEDDTFDLVHMRGFVMALRLNEWSRVLNELFRVTKKGGFVQLMELDLRFSTKDQEAKRDLGTVRRTLVTLGQEPCVVHQLPQMISRAGFTFLRNDKRSIPLGGSDPISHVMLDDWERASYSARHVVGAALGMPENVFVEYITNLVTRFADPETQSHVNWFCIVGQKVVMPKFINRNSCTKPERGRDRGFR